MKNIEEKMQKLEIKGTENPKKEGQLEIEKCNEVKDNDYFVPNWLIEVLEWIKKMEMANSLLSTSSRMLERICWPKLHGKVESHRVPFLFISGEENRRLHHSRPIIWGKSKTRNCLEYLPIPLVAPPDYIAGLDWITICYLDEQLLQFFKCIAPMLKNCTLEFNNWTMDDDYQRAQMRKLILILADKMSMFYLEDFHKFDLYFPELMNKIQFIGVAVRYCEYGFEPLFKWLTEKRMDGKQKILRLIDKRAFYSEFGIIPHSQLERIKKEFSASIRRSNFLIWQDRFDDALFRMENKKIGEILELYENKRGHRYLARYPKWEEHWKEEGERKAWPCDEDSTWIVVDNWKNDNWMEALSICAASEKFKQGIQKILWNKISGPVCSEINAHMFIMVDSYNINYQHLYSELKKIIKKHLQTSIQNRIMESIGGDYFAETLNGIWNDHNESMKSICSLDLNRFYVSKTGLLGVYELGMEIFGKEIVDHPPINEHLKATFGEDLVMAKGKIEDSLIEFLATRING